MKILNVDGVRIEGESVSGLGTCIVIPSLDLVFDIGICTPAAIQCRNVLISHSHIDHLAAAVQHAASRALHSMTPTRFFVPVVVAEKLKELFVLWAKLQSDEVTPCEIIPLAVGETLALNKTLFIRPFKTDHRIPSQGYSIIERRNKLRAEFAALSGQEIAKLRQQQGVDVTEVTEVVQVVYTGDTRATIWDTIPEILEARVIITEATFIGTEMTPEKASLRGHTHLSEIGERAERFAAVHALVLTHFSNRHSPKEIEQAASELPEAIRQKTFLL